MKEIIKEIIKEFKSPYYLEKFYALLITFILNVILTSFIVTYYVEFSGFIIALDYVWLAMFAWFWLDLVWFRSIKFFDEMKHNPYLLPAIILGIFLLLSAVVAKSQVHLDTAISYVGIVEKTGNNDGEEIEMFLASVGGKPGMSYCAAFVSYVLNQVQTVKFPKYRGLMARGFARGAIPINKAMLLEKVSPGDILVWQRGNSIFGHVGFIIEVNYDTFTFETVEANTSSGDKGSQYDGDGIYIRERKYNVTNYFRMTHINKVLY